MRENRTYGSEGGKRHLFPTPIRILCPGCYPVHASYTFVSCSGRSSTSSITR